MTTEPKFTPGPWKVSKERWRCGAVFGGDHFSVAQCYDGTGRTQKAAKENAKLIAAAPEMLNALLLAAVALEHGKPQLAHYPEPVERHNQALELVRAAIAKADGRKS